MKARDNDNNWVINASVVKHYPGCYRLSISTNSHFAQIKSKGQKTGWLIEIRHTETGNLIHYGGIHKTLTRAIAEGVDYLLQH